MKYGLREDRIESIQQILACYTQIEQAVLYGSRAKGNYRIGSDIDLTLKGNKIDFDTFSRIATEIDDLEMPYFTDLSIFDQLNNTDLIEHINRAGIVIYEQDKHNQ